MTLTPKPNTFTAGATILSAEHNENFDALFNLVNGNLDNNNIKSSAAIADTKLAQLTTAGKVSGSALTGLASTPSGAGELPIENISSIDENDMASDSDEKVPTQQSVKAYVDTEVSDNSISSIKDYNTSASASTAKDQSALIIAYGTQSVSNASSQAITNLSFTSSTSFRVTLSINDSSAPSQEMRVVQNSGSQFTIYNGSSGTYVINWIAIGT